MNSRKEVIRTDYNPWETSGLESHENAYDMLNLASPFRVTLALIRTPCPWHWQPEVSGVLARIGW